jgi:hypothetical protein
MAEEEATATTTTAAGFLLLTDLSFECSFAERSQFNKDLKLFCQIKQK